MIPFIDSSNEYNSEWLVSFACRNVGADIDVKSCINFALAADDMFWM